MNEPELLATLLAGFIAPVLTQIVKVKLHLKDANAVILTTAVSLLLSLGIGAVTHTITSWADILTHLVQVFGIATIIYNVLKQAGLTNNA